MLITARAQEDDIARGTNVGADAYLTKPFDPGEMIRVVRELAGARPPEPHQIRPNVITRDLRHAITSAVAAAGFEGPAEPGLRPTGTPGQYAASVALALGANPRQTAAASPPRSAKSAG